MSLKHRLSATVDPDLMTAVEDAVAQGRAGSVSAWVNEALRLKLAQDRRLAALADFVAAYERAHGEITESDMAQAARDARARATAVRGPASRTPVRQTRRRRTG